jgi:hypothetical protein
VTGAVRSPPATRSSRAEQVRTSRSFSTASTITLSSTVQAAAPSHSTASERSL